MSLGEKAKLLITYDYAYGERGHPAGIPPKADLTFEVRFFPLTLQLQRIQIGKLAVCCDGRGEAKKWELIFVGPAALPTHCARNNNQKETNGAA